MLKIFTQIILLLVVYISISFANQTITLEVDKADIDNVAEIELYQDDDLEPFVTLNATLPKPWEVTADIISINGVLSVHAIPIDANGIKVQDHQSLHIQLWMGVILQ